MQAEQQSNQPPTSTADPCQGMMPKVEPQKEHQWLQQLAAVDSRGAAGADQATQAPSTAGWLRARLRLGAGAAHSACGPPGPCSVAPWRRPARP